MLLAAAALLAALPAGAQYPGQVTKGSKDTPELRSIAVLEWTGDEGNPTASRLIPVAVLDGGELQDGGVYLARPEPLALVPEVEYELEVDGKPVGLYDIKNAGQQLGSWVGFGSWRPMPHARLRPSAKELAQTRVDEDDAQSDTPVLHRKHAASGTPSAGAGSGSGSGSGGDSGSSGQAEPSDPDRPVLHKAPAASGTDTTGSTPAAGTASTSSGAGTPGSITTTGAAGSTSTSANSGTDASAGSGADPDRPTLHRGIPSSTGSGSGTSASSNDGPDLPVPTKKANVQAPEAGSADSAASDSDPDRPRLQRGKSSGDSIAVTPSLKGSPVEVQQAVAVSDAKNRPPHPWNYAWSNPDDEDKMKSALEDIARQALGLNPPAPTAKRSATRTPTRKSAKPSTPPPPPASLEGEQFHVFELAYGSGATMVLSAHTDGPAAEQKFVTLIAQPDLYGNVLVLLKNVTDGAHLDEKPRMRLVDAVDALADNRGELLFELRGATERQFALYRVLRGQAEKLFVTAGGEFGSASSE